MYRQIKIDNHTWAYETVMDDGDSVRFFVLDGEKACLVIDSGFFPVDVKAMAQELLREQSRDRTEEGALKPILLANTHGDMDHTGGNGSFEEFYMTEADYVCCGLREQYPDARLIPAEEGTAIDLGGRIIRYIMAPGHTRGNTVLFDETNRVLFPGDIIQTGTIFLFGDHRCPELYAQSLQKVLQMKSQFSQIYASHGQLVLPPDAVDQEIEAWDLVLQGKVQPESREVFGNEVDFYSCGFSNFYCNKGSRQQ